MTNAMKMELENLRHHIINSFKDEYEPNSYKDNNLNEVIFDMCSRETIYTQDAETLIKTYPLSMIHLFLESKLDEGKSVVEFPVSPDKIVYNAMVHYCFEYMYGNLLKTKQEIDKKG